jgi:hypothetical protein
MAHHGSSKGIAALDSVLFPPAHDEKPESEQPKNRAGTMAVAVLKQYGPGLFRSFEHPTSAKPLPWRLWFTH